MKITSTKCTDGKRHKWIYPELFYTKKDKFSNMGIQWCKKCGSLTEFCFIPMRKRPNVRISLNDDFEILKPELIK
jgi:hypothetical protein